MDNFNADTVYRLIDKQRPNFVLLIGKYEMQTISVLKDGLGRYIYDKGSNTLFGYDLQIVDGSCFKLTTIIDEHTYVEKNVLPHI